MIAKLHPARSHCWLVGAIMVKAVCLRDQPSPGMNRWRLEWAPDTGKRAEMWMDVPARDDDELPPMVARAGRRLGILLAASASPEVPEEEAASQPEPEPARPNTPPGMRISWGAEVHAQRDPDAVRALWEGGTEIGAGAAASLLGRRKIVDGSTYRITADGSGLLVAVGDLVVTFVALVGTQVLLARGWLKLPPPALLPPPAPLPVVVAPPPAARSDRKPPKSPPKSPPRSEKSAPPAAAPLPPPAPATPGEGEAPPVAEVSPPEPPWTCPTDLDALVVMRAELRAQVSEIQARLADTRKDSTDKKVRRERQAVVIAQSKVNARLALVNAVIRKLHVEGVRPAREPQPPRPPNPGKVARKEANRGKFLILWEIARALDTNQPTDLLMRELAETWPDWREADPERPQRSTPTTPETT